jgi:type II secretion system protein N
MVGFPIFYLVCLAVFSVWTFPFDKVRDQAVARLNQWERETNGQMEFKIDELGPSWLNGVSAKGVQLITPSPEPGKPPVVMKVDEASVNISLLGLLVGSHNVSFSAAVAGGSLKGQWDESSKERSFDITVDGVDLAQLPMVSQAVKLPVEGTISGTIKLTMPDLKMSKASGSVSLETANFSAGDGKAKLMGLIALPKLTLGTMTVSGDAKDGVLKFSKLSAGGKDVELQGDGRLQLREQLPESFCDLNLKLKINDAYRGKSDTTKALFGEPGSTGPNTLELTVPQVKQAKRPDGFYGAHVHGILSRPDIDPAPVAATPGGGGTTRGMIPGGVTTGGVRGPG